MPTTEEEEEEEEEEDDDDEEDNEDLTDIGTAFFTAVASIGSGNNTAACETDPSWST